MNILTRCTFVVSALLPCSVMAYYIDSYTVDMYLSEAGSVQVQETIVFDAVEGDPVQFERNIPVRFALDDGLFGDQKIVISSPQATWNNSGEQVVLATSERSARITVGDGFSETVAGEQTLELTYEVEGALIHEQEKTTLEWEALNSTDYEGVGLFAGSIHTPREYPVHTLSCETSELLGSASCSVLPRIEGTRIAYFAHQSLEGGESVHIGVDFEQGIQGQVFVASLTWWEWLLIILGGLLLFVLVVLGVMWVLNKHKKSESLS